MELISTELSPDRHCPLTDHPILCREVETAVQSLKKEKSAGVDNILHISYKDHVTNEEVHAKIQWAIGPHKDLLTVVKRCKLQWYGHVSC